ncbi:MAG: hypothetical protein VYA59_08975 [Pseudomonadota bacterium]|nr:hypothetical protein [Pseudomonadota bacterium]
MSAIDFLTPRLYAALSAVTAPPSGNQFYAVRGLIYETPNVRQHDYQAIVREQGGPAANSAKQAANMVKVRNVSKGFTVVLHIK